MTTIPAVMFIEMALDLLRDQEAIVVNKEVRAFQTIGELGTRITGMKVPEGVDLEALTDLEKGYLIGLETARAILAMMPSAIEVEF